MEKLIENIKKGAQTAKTEAGRLTKVVIDKTTNIVDITKLSLAKNDTESKISTLYRQIGESIYKKYLSGRDFESDISDVCVEIDKFKAELDELSDQIAGLKNTVVCTKCGQYNNKDSEYCSKCGTHITSETETVAPDVIVDVVSPNEE
ncbi:MAG: zinc ribbon domain-containing protein [Clostridiales bacterium]|nr:zinc ribbon domain-containing protein [Clostridiales bacterium]